MASMKYDKEKLQRFAEYHNKKWWIEARKIFGDSIGVMPAVKMNARLTSTAGRAFIEDGYSDFSCYLMEKNAEHFAKDTIPHELSHHIAYRLYGDKGHGKAWKMVALKLYGQNNTYHTMETLNQAKRK